MCARVCASRLLFGVRREKNEERVRCTVVVVVVVAEAVVQMAGCCGGGKASGNHGNGFAAATTAAENFIRGCYIPFNHAAAAARYVYT